MILPIITSISREILRSVPNLQREAAYALGATRWEVLRIAVLSYARRGLFGAAILGLGRALGETMAVTMVIGNRPQISASLFAPGLHACERDRQRVHGGDDGPLPELPFRTGPGAPRRHDPGQRRRADHAEEHDGQRTNQGCLMPWPPPPTFRPRRYARWRKMEEQRRHGDPRRVRPRGHRARSSSSFISSSRAAPARSTGTSSPSCPSPPARWAAAWPTRSSGR